MNMGGILTGRRRLYNRIRMHVFIAAQECEGGRAYVAGCAAGRRNSQRGRVHDRAGRRRQDIEGVCGYEDIINACSVIRDRELRNGVRLPKFRGSDSSAEVVESYGRMLRETIESADRHYLESLLPERDTLQNMWAYMSPGLWTGELQRARAIELVQQHNGVPYRLNALADAADFFEHCGGLLSVGVPEQWEGDYPPLTHRRILGLKPWFTPPWSPAWHQPKLLRGNASPGSVGHCLVTRIGHRDELRDLLSAVWDSVDQDGIAGELPVASGRTLEEEADRQIAMLAIGKLSGEFARISGHLIERAIFSASPRVVNSEGFCEDGQAVVQLLRFGGQDGQAPHTVPGIYELLQGLTGRMSLAYEIRTRFAPFLDYAEWLRECDGVTELSPVAQMCGPCEENPERFRWRVEARKLDPVLQPLYGIVPEE